MDEVTDDYWSGSYSASRPALFTRGMGIDLCVTVCLTVGLLGSGGVCVYFCLCACVCQCVCARWPHKHTGLYPLQPVQETNKLHFNFRNINFLFDGKLISPPSTPPTPHLTLSRYTVSLLGSPVNSSDIRSMHRATDEWGRDLTYLLDFFVGFLCWYVFVQQMSMFKLLLLKALGNTKE